MDNCIKARGIGRIISHPIFFLSLMYVFLLYWSWMKWADIIVDFGAQLYVPSQIALGKVLYKDIKYLHGPFSMYFIALLFKIFGRSLNTIVIGNIIILYFFMLILYRFFLLVSDKLNASFAMIGFLIIFAFSHYLFIGNYNYICPYSHELIHGLYLSIGLIFLCFKIFQSPSEWKFSLLGFLWGIIFLTKFEILVSISVTIFTALLIYYFEFEPSLKMVFITLTVLAFSCFIPISITVIYFSGQTDFETAIKFISKFITLAVGTKTNPVPFYKMTMGTLDLSGNLVRMGISFLSIIFFISLFWYFSGIYEFLGKKGHDHLKAIWAFFVIIIIGYSSIYIPWLKVSYGLPVACPFIFFLLARDYRRLTQKSMERSIMATLMIWSVFSFFLMGKILLNVKFSHYGFVLSMPACLLLFTFIGWYLPQYKIRSKEKKKFFRFAFGLAVLILTANCFTYSDKIYASKNFELKTNGNKIMAYPPTMDIRTRAVEVFLQYQKMHLKENATLVVMPSGVMINFLSHKYNPTGVTNFKEIVFYGRDEFLRRMINNPSEYILLFHNNDLSLSGAYFGRIIGYGRSIMEWTNTNYSEVISWGEEPFKSRAFGMKLLKRKW